MAPSKHARKGKKAWRKNIDVSEVDGFREKTTYQERRGPAVETLQDSELFFLDKTAGSAGALSASQLYSRKRKSKEKKPLRSQLIIKAAHETKPVVQPVARRKVSLLAQRQPNTTSVKSTKTKASVISPEGDRLVDLWDDDNAPSTSDPKIPDPYTSITEPNKKTRPATLKKDKPIAPAVEVDQAGCSYNPDVEHHQDALAELVATENKKLIKRELHVKPWMSAVLVAPQDIDELDMLQVDEEPDDEPEANQTNVNTAALPNAVKKTRKDRNKEKRRRELEKSLEVKQKLKKQRRELDALPVIQSQLEAELELQAAELARRQIAEAEKAALLPPRLGKHKYEPPSLQVLTTDEVDGSLRRLKACPMVAQHRFKSLQRRGLVEPRKRIHGRAPGRKVEYEKGVRTEKALAAQEEIKAMRKANQDTRNKLK